MDKEDIIKAVAKWFGIDPDENGEYDIDSYDFQAGCCTSNGKKWLCLAEVVELIDNIM